jgi:hypothetical protein
LCIWKMFITVTSDAELSASNKQNPASIDTCSTPRFPFH